MSIHHHHQPYLTIHDFDTHKQYGWHNSLSLIAEVSSGDTVSYQNKAASDAQVTTQSSVEDVANIDFEKVNPVSGPVYVNDAKPGDTLEVEIVDFRQLDWGWTAIIPGFGLLADDFPNPALKTYDLKD